MVEVGDDVPLDADQVSVDLGCRTDADEHVAVALAAKPDRPEEDVERTLGAVGVDIRTIGDDRVRRGREVGAR